MVTVLTNGAPTHSPRTAIATAPIPVSEPFLAGNELKYVSECIAGGWVSSAGGYVERFEASWAGYCGRKRGVAVSSGTAALQVAVDALRIGRGDEVILPAFTIISCALAVVRAGATPVLVDCDPQTYCIDPHHVAAAITSRTRAIMPVHMYGHPAEMEALQEIAQRHGLAMIEDAAQAHGSSYRPPVGGDWRRCGSSGTLSTFSFYANKLVTTGEGGMVLVDDDALEASCRSLRNLGSGPQRFHHEELGYNFRMSNVQAAIGVAQVERIEATLARKREIGARYDALLSDVRGLRLHSPGDHVRLNRAMYPILLDDRVSIDAFELSDALREKGIETRPFFKGLHEQPALRALGLFEGLGLPVTEKIHRRGLYLPSGIALTDSQIDLVAGTVRSAVESGRAV